MSFINRLLLAIVPLVSFVHGLSGQATYYGGNLAGGMCSFSTYTLPSGTYGTAITDSSWAGAGICGACVDVTGPSGSTIRAMIVDQCPGCGTNHLDLFQDAFGKLSPLSAGVINVSYSIVACGITTPLRLRAKDGASKNWFSMQVLNANVQVSKLEVSTNGGSSWTAATRQPYNYFEISSGTNSDTVTVRITATNGKTLSVSNVRVASTAVTTATGNF